MNNQIITHVYCSDWEAIYFGDELVAEGHSINSYDVIQYINNKFGTTDQSIEVSDELAESLGSFPESFDKLVEYSKRFA